jgi:hypothetical protein
MACVAGSAGLAGCGAYVSTATDVTADAGVADADASMGGTTDTTGATTQTTAVTAIASSTEVNCRRGVVDCAYPGLCRDYVDSDGNGYCDLSQTSDSDQSQLSDAVASADESEQSLAGGCPLAPCVVCGICANLG